MEGLPELFKDLQDEVEDVADGVQQPESDPSGLREELLGLATSKRIKYTVKYIKKASDKTIESIYEDFKRQELDETNEQVSNILIEKFSDFMISLNVVKEDSGMEKELVENRLLKSDLKHIVGYITPYIPFVGLISGGLTVGKHVMVGKTERPEG